MQSTFEILTTVGQVADEVKLNGISKSWVWNEFKPSAGSYGEVMSLVVGSLPSPNDSDSSKGHWDSRWELQVSIGEKGALSVS